MSRYGRRYLIAQAVLLILLITPILTAAQVEWVKDFDSALKKAAKEEKFIVLDLSASW